jgi:glycosyltransferase involved in cell wall biosynthesis
MTVSILMLTYNHENFIGQAIESVLLQKVSFNLELIIADDASSDKTQDIIKSFLFHNPINIIPILREKNIGANKNWLDAYKKCSGRYIALLEGDDYWTDPNKLQKQVDFLDAHPEFVMSSTAYSQLNEATGELTDRKNLFPSNVITIENMLQNNYVSTLTCMFRNHLFPEFPEGFYHLKIGDWPLHIMNAQYGNIKYFGDWVSGVYRVHDTGVWSNELMLKKHIAYAEVFEFLKENMQDKYRRTIDDKIVTFYYSAVIELYKKKLYQDAKPYIEKIETIKGFFSKEFVKLKLKKLFK